VLSITQSHGDQIIAGHIREQVRLLGEHVVDRRLLEQMRECLQPIEQPREPGVGAGVQALAAPECAGVQALAAKGR